MKRPGFLRHLRLLTVLIIVATLSFAVRVGDFVAGMGGSAQAQQEVQAEMPPLPGAGLARPETSDDGEWNTDTDGLPPSPGAGEFQAVDWRDASEAEYDFSEVRAGLYKDLAERREQLDRRERELATRAALLEAAGRELDQKMRELTIIRDEIEVLMEGQSEEQEARIASLVQIYEGMKAKDAARIFNTLDIDVLISVMSRMTERRSGPILAEMSPERARTVTILLAQQRQLPTLPAAR